MIKVLSIFGTRPEAIKMAPVVQELWKYPELIESKICITGQHREMLDQVMDVFNLKPDFDLDLMEEDQTLSELTSRAITGLDRVLLSYHPDLVLVQGDTTTVLAGSLAAYYHKIPVGHVEAGLRSFDRYNPFPEEINRRLTDALATFYFAPTGTARDALIKEGFSKDRIYQTGNTVIDALHLALEKDPSPGLQDLMARVGQKRMILLTAHRRENFGDPLTRICRAVEEITRRFDDVVVVYPVHLNPNVRNVVYSQLSGIDRVILIEPQSYLDFVHLMDYAHLVLTDSGGIQEEAPALGTPVLVLRLVTERPEAVEAGTVSVVGTGTEDIIRETSVLLEDQDAYRKMAAAVSPYGDGHAAERIVKVILEEFHQ